MPKPLSVVSKIEKTRENIFIIYSKMRFLAGIIFFISFMRLQAAPSWMLDQIHEDLQPFQQSGFDPADLDHLLQGPLAEKYLFVKFSIIDNKLYLYPPSFETDPRASCIARSIREILSKRRIMDLDFVATIEDSLDGFEFPAPVFAFAKDPRLSPTTVLIPDPEALSGNQAFLKDVARGNNAYPWSRKINRAFWRGATTGGFFSLENFLLLPRSLAVEMSIRFPDLIDARFTTLAQCDKPDIVRKYYMNYFGESVSVEKHLKYKYQLLIDGNTCAYSRAYWQLFANCTIFKQESPSIQWFYRCLKPWVHYVPLRSDLSDLPDVVSWARNHDAECLKISRQANEFARNNLREEHVLEYLELLLNEYARLPTGKP